jgi:hypothetical protein
MAKYVRKTVDEWHTQGNYGCGWETVTIDDNYADAKQMLRDYRENEPEYPHRLIKKRVRKENV